MTNTAECDAADRKYHVVALKVPIVFNRDGDHDHNGLIFALGHNKQALDCLREEIQRDGHSPRLRPPHPLVRPLVLRARVGETVEIHFENHISHRHVGMHLVADGYDVLTSDGAHVGKNPSSLAGPPDGPPGSNRRTYVWHCRHEGVFPFHDAGNLSGGDDGTNVHGLFGALVVEPAGAAWSDPVSGKRLDEECREFRVGAMTMRAKETSYGTTQTACYSRSTSRPTAGRHRREDGVREGRPAG